MTVLDDLLPEPRLREVDHVDVGVPLARAHEAVRHLDLNRSVPVRALFSLRTLAKRLHGESPKADSLRLDDIGAPGTGFHIVRDEPASFVVASVGRFWQPDIEFADAPSERFAAFDEPGWGKLAWELRFEPLGEHRTRIVVEVRVTATDDDSWRRFRRYFYLIGPFSRFIRRHVLELAVKELGAPESEELTRPLAGDELVPEARAQVTHGITIDAPPRAIWPWLVQMGCGRGGWYSYDRLDNAGVPSARRILPELQTLRVGDELAASPRSPEGFSVERLEPERALVLHGLFDLEAERRVPRGEARPPEYLEVSWAFVLEPLGPSATRLVVRVRADLMPDRRAARAFRLHVVHRIMQTEQLRNLKRRAEGTLPKHVDTARDVGEGLVGALGMLIDLGTPFLRGMRSHFGLTKEEAARAYPGDGAVPDPRWGWTHGVEIDAAPERVWPWIAQMGQDKAGFYSYQWLENLVGCDIQNSAVVRPEWQRLRPGDAFKLHPTAPPLEVREVEEGRHFLVTAGLEPEAGEPLDAKHAKRGVRVSWLFMVEPLEGGRSRFVSRYRVSYGEDVRERLTYGPWLAESLGFVMDRAMLLGVKSRAEAARAGSS